MGEKLKTVPFRFTEQDLKDLWYAVRLVPSAACTDEEMFRRMESLSRRFETGLDHVNADGEEVTL